MLFIANYINQPSTFWRRSFQKKIGHLNEDLHFCMDYDLWLRFKKLSEPMVIPSPLSAFRIHSTSKGGTQYRKQFEEELKVLEQNNSNKLLQLFHLLHNKLITFVYFLTK